MGDLELSKIDLNLLVSLDALLRHRSVTRAAKQLGVSQSAMSHQLRRLRSTFDDPLLVASQGGMVPSSLAEVLELPVRQALSDLSRAVRGEASFDPATSRRSFAVAMMTTAELALLPPLMQLLHREAPDFRVHVQSMHDGTFGALQDGEIDLAIGPEANPEESIGLRVPGLRRRVLMRSGPACVVRRTHSVVMSAREHGGLTFEQYLGLQHVRVPRGGTSTSPVDIALAALGMQRNVVASTSCFDSAARIAAVLDLAVTMPRNVGEGQARELPLEVLTIPFSLPDEVLVMNWHERYHHDPANRWLREAMTRLLFPQQGER